MRKLFFVHCDTTDGESLDWFVVAVSKAEALELWREIEMVKDSGEEDPDAVFLVNAANVGHHLSSCALDWNDNGVYQV